MNLDILRRLWRSLRSDPETAAKLEKLRPVALRAALWLIATEFLVLLEVIPIKLLIDELGDGEAGWREILPIAGLALAIYGAASLVQFRMDVVRNNALWLFYIIINGHGTRKQLSLGADWHAANSTSRKESVLSKNHKKVDYMLDQFFFEVLPLTVRVTFIALGIFLIGWEFGLLAVGTIALYLWMAARNEKRFEPLRKEYRAYTKRIEQSDSELAANAAVIREQGIEDDLSGAHDGLLTEHWEREVPRHTKFRFHIWRQDQLITLSQALFVLASFLAWTGGVTLGTVVLANAWMQRIYSNIWRYGAFQYVMNEGSEALKELVTLFETEPTIKTPPAPQWPAKVEGRIELRDVWFTYPNTSRPALSGVNLTIEPGMTVALVGDSGGGKTTTARVILHQYEPTRGSVLIDGVDLREIDDKRYRREILGIVPQEPGLLDRSVLENIGMVRPGASDEEIRSAAERAGAARFIHKLPQRYDTLVGERGVVLSGGERQRVAIARALLRRAPIMVLDEPTSSLDPEVQLAITEELGRLTKSRESTILIIAHRFSTIAMADLIVVMKDGRVSEIGTHDELMRGNGLYTRLRRIEGMGD